MPAENAHYVRKPVTIGDEVTALCGERLTITRIPVPGDPVCKACYQRWLHLPGDSYTWTTVNTGANVDVRDNLAFAMSA